METPIDGSSHENPAAMPFFKLSMFSFDIAQKGHRSVPYPCHEPSEPESAGQHALQTSASKQI